MSGLRYALIARAADRREVDAILQAEAHGARLLADTGQHMLFCAEGRAVAEAMPSGVLVVSLDARHPGYEVNGPRALAAAFRAHIRLAMGFQVGAEHRSLLARQIAALRRLADSDAAEGGASAISLTECVDDNLYSVSVDVSLGVASPGISLLNIALPGRAARGKAQAGDASQLRKVIRQLSAIATRCEDAGIEHRVALFETAPGVRISSCAIGEVLGELPDAGPWIGPAASVIAEWPTACTCLPDTDWPEDTCDLVINGDEILVNGNTPTHEEEHP